MRIGLASVIATALIGIGSPALAESSPPAFGGAYIGLNAGATWGSASYATDPGCLADPAAPAVFCNSAPSASAVNGAAVAASGSGDLSGAGFTGGIQGGYNWQSGKIVFGGEGDFGAYSFDNSINTTGAFPLVFAGTTYALTERASTNWLITLRGRIGYTVTPYLMLYGTGGLALTDFRFASGYSDNAISPGLYTGGTGFGARSEVKAGWVAGGGGEWLLDGPWSIKAEYLYLDFGSMSVAVPTSNTAAFTQTMLVDADLSAQVARVGINYRP
jgi:outer membrane immunogenic protein